ncbi:ABC transporter substrate-binding protein [Pseudomonas abietaniphila]
MAIEISRRRFSIGIATLAGAVAIPRIVMAKPSVLRVFTWEGYAEPEFVSKFERENNCKVSLTYTGSVDEMFAKMQGSRGRDFDVVSFDTGSTSRYVSNKLVQPLSIDQLPNLKNMLQIFRDQPAIQSQGKLYAVPHAWGSLPLIYSKKTFPTPPESWSVMWDPKYAQQVIGLDDAINNTAFAGLLLGYPDPFQLTDEQLQAVQAKLIEIKKNLLTYYAGYDEGVSIFADNSAKLMFAMGEPQARSLQKKGVDVGCTIPKEGGIGWIDCQSITTGATDISLAHRWINACLDHSVANIMSKVGYGNVLDDELNKEMGMTYADRLKYLAQPESYEKRTKIWNTVKSV